MEVENTQHLSSYNSRSHVITEKKEERSVQVARDPQQQLKSEHKSRPAALARRCCTSLPSQRENPGA